MVMPYNLQRLPREALEVLRYLISREGHVSTAEMESGTGLSARLVGRAIRRLVNFDQIEMRDGLYSLTTDGTITARQLLDYEAALRAEESGQAIVSTYLRRLTVVMPRVMRANTPADMFIGVNPPSAGAALLPEDAQVDLRISAAGGVLSIFQLSLLIPPDKAAVPGRVSLTPAQPGRPVRVRVDAFQLIDLDEAHPLGGMYFDVRVPTQPDPDERTVRAVGMDLMLKPPRQFQ